MFFEPYRPAIGIEITDNLRFPASEYLACCIAGITLAQLGWVAVWFALVPGRLIKKLFFATMAIGLLNFFFILGFWLAEPGMPIEVMLVFIIGSLVGVAIYSVPFLIRRSYSSRYLQNINIAGGLDAKDDFQFSVKQLLVVTLVMAVLFAIGKAVIPGTKSSNAPWHEVIPFCAFYLVACCVLVFLTFALVFELKHQWLSLAGLVVGSLFVLPMASVYIMWILFGTRGTPSHEVYGLAAMFFVGHSATLFFGFVICRVSGFCLMTGDGEAGRIQGTVASE